MGPVAIAAVRAWHVLGEQSLVDAAVRCGDGGDPVAAVEDLARGAVIHASTS